MENLSNIGRIFYGLAIAGTGLLTIYYKDFPYYLLPPPPFLSPGPVMLTYISGIFFMLVGICIVLDKKTTAVSLLFGYTLLIIFCFLFIPYMFSANSNFTHLTEWENAEKELALSGGAFLVAGCFSKRNENTPNRFWDGLMPFGAILFSIPIISFGILHYQLAKDVATMVPSWIPYPVFWTYFAGTALLGSGIAIIFKIKPVLIATLLGIMIFIWVIILHIPRVIASPITDMGGEMISTFLALAYSGIAFVIAGAARKTA